MTTYYVTAVIVVEADCADTAVNAVAIAVQDHAIDTATCIGRLVGLDHAGEPVLEVFSDDHGDIRPVPPYSWTVREGCSSACAEPEVPQ